MFTIKQIHNADSTENRALLNQIQHLYEQAFSYYPQYSVKIAEFLKFPSNYDFEIVILVALGAKNRLLGFILSFYFPKFRYAYLDYIVANLHQGKHGYGTALYEQNKEYLLEKKCKALLYDVPTDDISKLKDKSRIKINQKRLSFYEMMGGYPIVNTLYDSTTNKANQGALTYLVYDAFGNPLITPKDLKKVISKILSIKGNMDEHDPKTKAILESISTTKEIQLRLPNYEQQSNQKRTTQSPSFDFVSTGDSHQIHHLKEKGYAERPARVTSILKGLESFNLKHHKPKSYSSKHILAVHTADLHRFIKKSSQLSPKELIYPNVFPIRNPDRIPKNWEMQAGYYCIDTFTPVTSHVYLAAKNAVNAALTGADLILKGSSLTYVLCRPPGHHAESKAFGGFCYFNNAAIAAHYLSQKRKSRVHRY